MGFGNTPILDQVKVVRSLRKAEQGNDCHDTFYFPSSDIYSLCIVSDKLSAVFESV